MSYPPATGSVGFAGEPTPSHSREHRAGSRRLMALAWGIGAATLVPRASRRALRSDGYSREGGTEMMPRFAFACVIAIVMASGPSLAQSPSPNGVKTLAPAGALRAEGTWSLGTRAGDFVFLAGMPGIDPATNTMVAD